jgi:hypothetical protein
MESISTVWARRIAMLAVIAAACVHSTMNFRFGMSLSTEVLDQYLFGVFGVAVDICKVFALAFAAYAFEKGRWVKGLACLFVWLTTIAYSSAAAMGFAALARDHVVASRSSDVTDYKAATSEQKRLTEQMEAARANPLFTETYGCTDYRKDAQKGAERKKAELCSAYWRADNAIAELKPQVKSATMTTADPQTALLASITGKPQETVAIALAVFLAVVAEIVSALGTWTFSASRRKPERRVVQGGKLTSTSLPPPIPKQNGEGVHDVIPFGRKQAVGVKLH